MKSPWRIILPSSELTPYEAWYKNGGVDKYASVFAENDEKSLEVNLVSRALADHSPFDGKSDVRALDIGCGTGRFTVMLLNQLARNHGLSQATVDLVDISTAAFRLFRQEAGKESACRIIVEQEIEKAWRSVDMSELSSPYDIVIADHVFYGEPLDVNIVHKLAGLITEAGVIVVALQTALCDLSHMRQELGIQTNAANMFRQALKQSPYPYQEMLYESRLRFNEDSPVFRDWFFASSQADRKEIDRAIEKYKQVDSNGDIYFNNQAVIFLVFSGR